MSSERLTIEPQRGATYSRNCFAVYKLGVYPRSSVLAGRQSRKFVEGGFATIEEAQAKYPNAMPRHSSFIPTDEMVRHLPDDTDY